MRRIILCLFIGLISCGQIKKQATDETSLNALDSAVSDKKETTQVQPPALNFLDSILQKRVLLVSQIRSRTIVDSFYYTHYPDATFEGDTVFSWAGGWNVALINYSDHLTCSKKLFLIFNAAGDINTDFKEISSDCDKDESAGHSEVSYTIQQDSVLVTTDKYFIHSEEGAKLSEVKRLFWKTDPVGRLYVYRELTPKLN